MSESPTEGGQGAAASANEPTAQQPVQQPTAESQSQETISQSQGSEAVATTPTNTNSNEGESAADDSLAKFAKSQGVDDVTQLSEREQKFLKIAHDNQKFARSAQPKVEDTVNDLGKPADDATELAKLNARVARYEYKEKTNAFWGADGRDRTLEPVMVQILNDKKEQFGKDYAYQLSQDLDTLYAMAKVTNGTASTQDTEQVRREERESINKSLSAGAPNAHANTGQPAPQPKVTLDWIRTEYDSRNPEHRKLVDEFYQNGRK